MDQEAECAGISPNTERRKIKVASEALMSLQTDSEFRQLCQSLELSEAVEQKAWALWFEIQVSCVDIIQDNKRVWFACALYITAIDIRLPYGVDDPQNETGRLGKPCFTVAQLLQCADITITEFFAKMRVIRQNHMISDAVSQSFVTLEKRYCIMLAIFDKFEKLFLEIFRNDQLGLSMTDDPAVHDSLDPRGFLYRKKLSWLLFLLTAGSVNGSLQLIFSFHLLICCLEFVIRSTPAFLLFPPFDSLRLDNNNSQDPDAILKELCDTSTANYEEVISLKNVVTETFLQSLMNGASALDMPSLLSMYKALHEAEGSINEMLFLDHDPHVLVNDLLKPKQLSRLTGGSGDTPITPVRAALSTVRQLKCMLSNASDSPSEALLAHFKACSIDPTKSTADRVDLLKQSVVDKFVSIMGEKHRRLAEERLKLSCRLYYRVLEALINKEGDRLSQIDLSPLLNNDEFHKSFLACSAEIVMQAYSISWNTTSQSMNASESEFAFPWILKAFDLKAYSFYKSLESFITAEPKLTKDIIRHLQGVENMILETIAWEENSPLWDTLAICPRSTPMPIPGSTAGPTNTPLAGVANGTVIGLFQSPVKRDTSSPNGNRFSPSSLSPTPRISSGLTRSRSLNMFFVKVCKLGYLRLQALCSLLDITADLQKIWTCFEYCITHKPDLLKGRHLDQVMMSSVYIMCKIQEKDIGFKTIVNVYKDLPHATPEVYKMVYINPGEYGTIIVFYNRIFMASLKDYIQQFSNSNPRPPLLSPVPKAIQSPLPVSPCYTVPGRSNFYVSPMKRSPFKTPMSPSQMTPKSLSLYCFGEGIGFSEKLKQFNESMSATKRRLAQQRTPTRTQKRLLFDKPDDMANNTSSKSEDTKVITIRRVPFSPEKQTRSTTAQDNANQNQPLPSKPGTDHPPSKLLKRS